MEQEDIIWEFEDAAAILNGHFILSSGLHSNMYLQCARVLMDPSRAAKLCEALPEKIKAQLPGADFDMVVAPAMGGVVVGYEMGRQLNLPTIFCERVDGKFTLRRGFNIPEGAKILVVEDVVTTGKSSKEAFKCIEEHGGNIIAEAALVDRSNGDTNLGVPFVPLVSFDVQTFDADNIPDELQNVQAVKPGSRFLK